MPLVIYYTQSEYVFALIKATRSLRFTRNSELMVPGRYQAFNHLEEEVGVFFFLGFCFAKAIRYGSPGIQKVVVPGRYQPFNHLEEEVGVFFLSFLVAE